MVSQTDLLFIKEPRISDVLGCFVASVSGPTTPNNSLVWTLFQNFLFRRFGDTILQLFTESNVPRLLKFVPNRN